MACLNLTNGNFALKNFSNANANAGQITITRVAPNPNMGIAGSITVTHSAFANSVFLNGDIRSVLFGGNRYVALLKVDDNAGIQDRHVSIVEFTVGGATPGVNEIHTQSLVSSGVTLPQFLTSPGAEDLFLVFSSTGQPNEVQRLSIDRSDTGDVVLAGPLTVSNLTGAIGAQVTATNLVINHPNSGFSQSTSGPRPAGLCGSWGRQPSARQSSAPRTPPWRQPPRRPPYGTTATIVCRSPPSPTTRPSA